MKGVLAFFLIAIVMLADGSFFTWLFRGTPLIMWRQIIWAIGLYLIYRTTVNSIAFYRIKKVHLWIFMIILLQAMLTYAVYGFNLMRLAFAFWTYFSGLPFILMPYVFVEYARDKSIKSTVFYDIFIGLGIFLTAGLITDYLTNGMFTRLFLISGASDLEGLLKDGRYCFLAEAPTTFGVYYCFCMFCTLYRLYLAKTNVSKLILLIISLSFIIGGWLTGSRQIVLVLSMIFIVMFGYYTLCVKDRKTYITFAVGLLIVVMPNIITFLYSDEAYSNRYSNTSIQEDPRSKAWKRGFYETVEKDIRIFLFGKAVALSQGQKANPNEEIGSHYENTFYSRIGEIGLTGCVLLLLPLLYFIKYRDKWDLFNVGLLSIIIAYLIICYISPNGSHQTTQMVIYLTLGLLLNKEFFEQSDTDIENEYLTENKIRERF